MMTESLPAAAVRPLLEWYDANARVLPWRDVPTPYRVWVSEIMLQQTRVEAGKPYFERFVRELPDIAALAAADEQQLLKLWEGLGYYNRVRNMQKAARIVLSEYGGRLPEQPEQLEKLPGIGAYTAGAIASIAFGRAAAAVDGNVLRVLSRLTAYRGDVTASGVKEKTAAAILKIQPERRGDFNQALMELGAMVCLPNGAPKCGECPWQALCEAKKLGLQNELPVLPEKKARKTERLTVLLLRCGGYIAIRRRPAEGLLAHLWEYPCLPGTLTREELAAALEQKGWRVREILPAACAKHIFTHIEWQMTGYFAAMDSRPADPELVWVTPQELEKEYPVPSAFRAFTRLLV